MRWIGVLNGPNLNVLGTRQPEIYGSATYEQLRLGLQGKAGSLGVGVEVFQSNHEGELVDRLQAWSAEPDIAGVIVNPAGLGHTSVALRDACELLPCPFVEVHLSNVAAREPFRRTSLLSDLARGVVSGLGVFGYEAALEFLARRPDVP
ncbi:MAG: type II 3-dehydroquinate dehydratase [Gemmatimonadetes bacterium]|nr:type II 3-dehydroquinate dehydratase [Gemmatimonadota bacterium]